MLITKEVQLKWNQSNKQYLILKGYNFTLYKDIVVVRTEDLMENSNVRVEIKCDYCGESFTRKFYSYNVGHKIINKDACCDCRTEKIKESNLLIFGTEFASQNSKIRTKIKNTVFERFGVEHIMQNEKIKNDIVSNNLIKYGIRHTLQSQEFRNKGKITSLERYGVENPMQNFEIQEKARQTNLIRYGVDYAMQLPETVEKMKKSNLAKFGVEYNGQRQDVKEKISSSFYKNGTQKSSSQQLAIFNLLKDNNYIVELNYSVSRCNLDIALFIDNINIDVEYDGYHWHKDTKNQDRKRDEFLKSQGWKILRIKSSRKIPSVEQIKESINKLVYSDRTFTQIILQDWESKEVI